MVMSTDTVSAWTEISQLPLGLEGRVRFSRDAYHRMFDAGLLDNEKRYELIDGVILMRSPISPGQGGLMGRLNEFFVKRLPDDLQCRVQLPIVVSNYSEPEPDLAIVRRQPLDYRAEHPTSAEVVLLIDVSKTSLTFDLGAKLQLYASAGITEYWVVDTGRSTAIVLRDRVGDSYRSMQSFIAPAKIAPLAAPACQLDLAWLFG
jgi:Uma2 family endonuclease